MTYRVRCRVQGGVTGTREAFLKKDGVIQEFNSFLDAQRVAEQMDIERNRQVFQTAYFSYWVVEHE